MALRLPPSRTPSFTEHCCRRGPTVSEARSTVWQKDAVPYSLSTFCTGQNACQETEIGCGLPMSCL